tara:strand:- start:227 stop:625 length:399 start_codon:yes stop_codon:yes gene_type:complete
MRKGDLVRLRPDDPEIRRILDWPSGGKDFLAYRPSTQHEKETWRKERSEEIVSARSRGESTFEIAFDSSGEPRLPPMCAAVPLPIDGIYIVERARCRVRLGYGNPTGGMTRILDTISGEHAYVRREMLEVIK